MYGFFFIKSGAIKIGTYLRDKLGHLFFMRFGAIKIGNYFRDKHGHLF